MAYSETLCPAPASAPPCRALRGSGLHRGRPPQTDASSLACPANCRHTSQAPRWRGPGHSSRHQCRPRNHGENKSTGGCHLVLPTRTACKKGRELVRPEQLLSHEVVHARLLVDLRKL